MVDAMSLKFQLQICNTFLETLYITVFMNASIPLQHQRVCVMQPSRHLSLTDSIVAHTVNPSNLAETASL